MVSKVELLEGVTKREAVPLIVVEEVCVVDEDVEVEMDRVAEFLGVRVRKMEVVGMPDAMDAGDGEVVEQDEAVAVLVVLAVALSESREEEEAVE